jgi:hypothetical protein
MPGPLEDDGELEAALGELTEEEDEPEEEEDDEDEEPVDSDVAEE